MNTTNEMLEPLKNIKRVEPSANLFSKIEQHIKEEQQNNISISKLMAACVILIVLIASNTFLIKKQLKSNHSDTDLTETFGINASNQLYHE